MEIQFGFGKPNMFWISCFMNWLESVWTAMKSNRNPNWKENINPIQINVASESTRRSPFSLLSCDIISTGHASKSGQQQTIQNCQSLVASGSPIPVLLFILMATLTITLADVGHFSQISQLKIQSLQQEGWTPNSKKIRKKIHRAKSVRITDLSISE